MNGNEAYTYAAFKAYRNYDGNGAAFGDTSIGATTTDVPDSSVYASLQSSDASKLVVVAINKATSDKVAGIRIEHSTVFTKASVYTIRRRGAPRWCPDGHLVGGHERFPLHDAGAVGQRHRADAVSRRRCTATHSFRVRRLAAAGGRGPG